MPSSANTLSVATFGSLLKQGLSRELDAEAAMGLALLFISWLMDLSGVVAQRKPLAEPFQKAMTALQDVQDEFPALD